MTRPPIHKVNQVIDGWSLQKHLGSGGNADVWQAARADGKLAALKILRTIKPGSEPYERFRIETSILEKLGAFPGILPLIDANIPSNPSRPAPAWLAMPIAETIRSALADQPSLKAVIEAMSIIANTLASLATKHNVYHRDIKPENLYRYELNWCIGDFGLVDYPDKASLTAPGKWVGPIHYLAPELLINPESSQSGPADVYSLAKTIWVLATGQNYPLPGYLLREVPQLQISSYITDERAYLIESLIEKATHPEPEKRPSMQNIADELVAWLDTRSLPSHATNLSNLQSKISPIIERQKRRKTIEDQCVDHVENAVDALVEQLRPLAQSLQEVTQLEVNLGKHQALSNVSEITKIFKMLNYLSYRGVGFFIQSPERIGNGNNYIELHGGIIIQSTKDGWLHISGSYALNLGAGSFQTIWVDTYVVEFQTAREEQVIKLILESLDTKLPPAINTFVEELQARGS